MKKVYLGLVLSLSLVTLLPAQSTLITWKLNSSDLATPTVYDNALTAYDFARGNGLSKLTFSATYVQADNWAPAWMEEAKVDYFEFGLHANPGETVRFSSLEFKEKRSSDGPRTVLLYYSRDDFKHAYLLGTLHLPDDIGVRTHSLPLDLATDNRGSLKFRLYAYGAESPGGNWGIRSETLKLKGSVEDACPSFSSTSALNVLQTAETSLTVSLQGGSVDKLLVASPSTDLMEYPYTGKSYSGNLQYGQGDAISNSNTFVIRASDAAQETITIENLEPGATYQLAVFDYAEQDMCYATQPTLLEVTTDCPTSAQDVKTYRYSAIDSEIGVDWVGPNCFDKYLLVASKNPFTGVPTSATLVGVGNFGTGSPVPGLGSDVYAVYYGSQRSREVVKRVENGTTYYLAIYTLYNGQWSEGVFFTATPEESCVPHTKERIFFNEVHYVNAGFDQDEGVEIAGAAGIDLSNYRINVFRVPERSNGLLLPQQEILLSGVIDDEGEGFGAVWFPIPNLPDSRGMMTLTNMVTDEVVFTIFNVAPNRLLMVGGGNIQQLPFERAEEGFGETESDQPGLSVQLVGSSLCPLDLLWSKLPHTRGVLNVAQRVLPVELISLAAERKGEEARIFWSTANEENSDYFLLEHSTDGRSFRPLAQVSAAGSSSFRQDYDYYDIKPSPGKNYYRLRQVDFDGTVYDHGVVSVRFDTEGKEWTIAPNPVLDYTNVQWSGSAHELLLIDNQGRVLRRYTLDAQADGGNQYLELSELPAGLYYLRLLYADQVEARPLLKQ